MFASTGYRASIKAASNGNFILQWIAERYFALLAGVSKG